MGCLTSKQERVAIERSQQIEHALNRQAFLGTKNVKILLLGGLANFRSECECSIILANCR